MDIMLIWMPTGTLITYNSSQKTCRKNAITFDSPEKARTYIEVSGRFEKKEQKHIAVVQQLLK